MELPANSLDAAVGRRRPIRWLVFFGFDRSGDVAGTLGRAGQLGFDAVGVGIIVDGGGVFYLFVGALEADQQLSTVLRGGALHPSQEPAIEVAPRGKFDEAVAIDGVLCTFGNVPDNSVTGWQRIHELDLLRGADLLVGVTFEGLCEAGGLL